MSFYSGNPFSKHTSPIAQRQRAIESGSYGSLNDTPLGEFVSGVSDLSDALENNVSSLVGDSSNGSSGDLGLGSNTFFGAIGKTLNRIASNGWDDWTGNTANRENIAFQKEYNDTVFQRADTQYQRTVADLRASGLSSQLAAGAPSTVAGTTAAPQRSVGNESVAMERLVGLINSIKSTNASTKVAEAQAANIGADTALKKKEAATYNERFTVEMMLKRTEARYTNAMTGIAQIDGQHKAEYWNAQINDIRMGTQYKNSLIKLAQKDQSLRDAQIVGEYQSHVESRARVDKINQETKNLKEEFYNIQQDFYNKLVENHRLNAQTELLLKQAAAAALDYDIKSYDYGLAQDWNIRTSDQQTKLNIFGLGSSNLESLIGGERLDYSPVTGQKRNYGQ